MEFEGIGFHPESLKQYRIRLQSRLGDLERKANEILGEHRAKHTGSSRVLSNVMLSSPQQVSQVLVNELGLLSPSYTSTKSRVLKEIDHPFAKIVLQHRYPL